VRGKRVRVGQANEQKRERDTPRATDGEGGAFLEIELRAMVLIFWLSISRKEWKNASKKKSSLVEIWYLFRESIWKMTKSSQLIL
jgi:hypothetical protein